MAKHLVQKENNKKEKRFGMLKEQINKKEINTEYEPDDNVTIAPKAFRLSPVLSVIVSLLLIVIIPFLALDGWMLKAANAIALLIAALEFIWNALDNFQEKNYLANEHFALLAAVLAFATGLELESVLILDAVRIIIIAGKKLNEICFEKINSFPQIVSDTANVETAEGLLEVLPEYVNTGEIIRVEAGEIIPLDGVVIEGISTIDTEVLSGQSSPWAVNEGYRVFSGCRNSTSPLRIKVTRSYEQSTANCLASLVDSSTKYLSRQEHLCNKIKKYYGLVILVCSIVLVVSISLLNGAWIENISRAVCLLSCACSSYGLFTIGMCYAKGTGCAVEKGIFVKGSDCIESIAKAETAVFDKTGIITEGRYIITDVFPNKVTERELLTMAATAERFSRHPIAVCLREAVGKLSVDKRSLKIEEIPGRGVSAFVENKQVYVGNASLLEEHGIKCAIPIRPGAAIHVAVDHRYWGHILITDRIRRGAFDTLENLRAQGVKKTVLLTGDVLSVAKPLASKLNFDMLRAELKPSEKVSAVDFLMSNRGDSSSLAFIGDGNSEEEIMSRVDVGISLGSLGSDAAMNYADVLIMDRDIKKIPQAFMISKNTHNTAMMNLIVWFAANAVMLVLSALGLLPPIIVIAAVFILSCVLQLNILRIK